MRSSEPQVPVNQTIDELEKVFCSSPGDSVVPPSSLTCPADIEDMGAGSPDGSSLDVVSEPFNQALLKQIQHINQLGVKIEGQQLSAGDLAGVLEGFARVIRGGDLPGVPRQGKHESEELRKLLVNAQETIIRLLNEQVTDRAKLSSMEAQLKFLPDLKDQADRTATVAFETESFRRELKSVRFELDAFRRSRLRTDFYRPRRVRSWWSWVTGRVLATDAISGD